jgi:sugar transferase (PEP-CTERM/EpsH1 system associated)
VSGTFLFQQAAKPRTAQRLQNSTRPKLLYLVHRVPYPPDKGDRIRAFHVLKHLAGRADLYVACLADEPVLETEAALRSCCTALKIVRLGNWARKLRAGLSLAVGGTATAGAFAAPALRQTLRDWTRDTAFDAVLASASSMAPYLQMAELRGVPAVVDLVDVDSQKWLDYAAAAKGPRRWLYQAEGHRLRRLERDLAGWACAVTLVSQAEADLYRSFCSAGRVHAVPNGVDLDYFQPQAQAAAPSCVFTGALDYRPNIDGLCWFCEQVWPRVYQKRPDAKLYLVGRKPAPAVRRLAGLDGVVVVGQVPDVRPHVAGAAVAVVPLRIARGLQNKVLEALAMARPTIVSPCCLAGLGAEAGVHLLSASSPREWTDWILGLFDDPAWRRRLGLAGRSYVEQNHRWETCLEPFDRLLGITNEIPAEELSARAV